MASLTFYGATQTVTGSKYLLECAGASTLVDCGLFQGLKELRLRNWAPPAWNASRLDSVVLTHAHIDHTGYLPRLVREGFNGPIFCTPATAELTEILLEDAARNQEDDAIYANRKGFSKHQPALPLYGPQDIPPVIRRLKPVPRERWFDPCAGIRMRFHDAGHLLGSSFIEAELEDHPGARTVRLVFSGDIGRYGAPLYHDPQAPPPCDYLVCESTYGDRDHPPERAEDQLADVVNESVERGGVLLFAAFAVGRVQQLVYMLRLLMAQRRIPDLAIHIDSPMAIAATNVYRRFVVEHDLSEAMVDPAALKLDGPNVHVAQRVEESKRLNQIKGPAIIISSSGMMTGGRILHHLRQRLPEAKNTIALGGFMAAGTRGRQLQDGAAHLKIHGHFVPVRAAVREVSGISGHADRSELERWLASLPAPKQVFLTHGELHAAQALAESLRHRRGWSVLVPPLGHCASLES